MTNQLFGTFAGGDDVSSYKPVPYYMSSKSYSLFLEDRCYSKFDFTKPDCVRIKIASPRFSARIISGDHPKELLQEYTQYCGRMAPLPEWASEGVILGIQGGEQKVEEIVERTLSSGVPVSGIWLQDWCGKRTQVGSDF